MPKQGILHDYDLLANDEKTAHGNKCHVCDAHPAYYQWSDYSGEGMCTECGCPYQLKWGTDEHKKKNDYPYLNLKEDFIPIAKEYWLQTKQFVCYGVMMSSSMPGRNELDDWLKEHHPEYLG